jgi:hypothetical protein
VPRPVTVEISCELEIYVAVPRPWTVLWRDRVEINPSLPNPIILDVISV